MSENAASVRECPACQPIDDHPQAADECTHGEGCLLDEAFAKARSAAWDIEQGGKLFVAANPWPLAAHAQREGLPTDRFRESDLVPDGQVLVIDLDAFKLLGDPHVF